MIESKSPAKRGKQKLMTNEKLELIQPTYSHTWITLRNVHHRRVELLFLDDSVGDDAGWEHRRHQKNQKGPHRSLCDWCYWDKENINFDDEFCPRARRRWMFWMLNARLNVARCHLAARPHISLRYCCVVGLIFVLLFRVFFHLRVSITCAGSHLDGLRSRFEFKGAKLN